MRRHTALGSCAAAAILLASCTQDRPTGIGPAHLGRGPSLAAAPAGEKIPGQYIVRFADAVQDVAGLAGQLAAAHGGAVERVYTHAIKGFAGKIPDAAAAALARHPSVLYVEQDQVVRMIATQSNPTWGLDRIDERDLPLDALYVYNATGAGVTAYIIDTGIRITHNEFDGEFGVDRASHGFDSIRDGQNGNDCNGHGTHVSGTVGGATYGVAKAVKLVAVRVLDCGGSGTDSGVIEGIDYVTGQKNANPSVPSVANMSLGGGFSQALNDAVTRSTTAGVTYGVAAGNDYGNACDGSPASTPSAITVGATDISDNEASFSDRGNCLDIWAPGVNITSSWNTADNATNTISGTSMATPHLVGAAALYLQGNPNATPAQVDDALTAQATTGKIKWSNPFGLKPPAPPPGQDYLLYTAFIVGTAPTAPIAPTGLTATTASSSQINLAWADNSNNESNFEVERCTGTPCAFAKVATVGANTTSYQDTGLSGGTSYTYRVRATNGGGPSDYTNEASATTTAPPAIPAAPSSLTATEAGQTQINLKWTDNADNEDGFKIERCSGPACTGFVQIATVGANVTTYSNTGLTAGTSYSYRVRANNGGGDSPYSNTASATTASPPPVPDAVARYTWKCGGTNGTSGRTCDFDGRPSDNEVSYLWNFGDGTATSTSATPRYRFSKTGTFQVKLEVKNSAGKAHSVTCAVTTGVNNTGKCNTP